MCLVTGLPPGFFLGVPSLVNGISCVMDGNYCFTIFKGVVGRLEFGWISIGWLKSCENVDWGMCRGITFRLVSIQMLDYVWNGRKLYSNIY